MEHKPSGLLSDSQIAGDLVRTDSVLAVHNEPDGQADSIPRAVSRGIGWGVVFATICNARRETAPRRASNGLDVERILHKNGVKSGMCSSR
jgi:hypothetical protein